MKYMKRPVVIEAVRWWCVDDCLGSVPFEYDPHHKYPPGVRSRTQRSSLLEEKCIECGQYFRFHGKVATGEDDSSADICPGDWIVTDQDGKRTVCSHDVFEKMYEPVEGE